MQPITLYQLIYFKSRLGIVLYLMVTLGLSSCKESLPITETTDNIGSQANLRVSSWENSFDLGKEEEPFVEYTFEYYDSGKLNGGKVGDFLNEIRFFISFRNFDGSTERDKILLENVPVSEMTPNEETANLEYTLRLTLDSALQKFDLHRDDIGVDDHITLDWEMNLKNGTALNPKCPDWPVGSSPVLCEIDITVNHYLTEDDFTGRYRFEQHEPGPFDMWLFSESFETELSIHPDNILNGRQFKAVPYSATGGLDSISVPLSFTRNVTTVRDLGTGYECTPGTEVYIGPVRPLSQYETNPADDSRFTLILNENSSGACGEPSQVAVFTVTKIE